MSLRYKSLNNKTFISSKSLNKSTINTSLMNISKQLNNISINDVNILKLKNKKNKMNSKNKTDSSLESEYNNISANRSVKFTSIIYKNKPHFDELYHIKFSFCHTESFLIKGDKNIYLLNKSDLRKKNFILKENLKFLLNEIKKYKKSEATNDDNQIKEYENKIEYYINEIKKYKKDIIILKEKYNNAIKENNLLQKYINSGIYKLNDFNGFHSLSKTDINKSITYKSNLNNLKNNNLNLKKCNTKDKNIIKENYSTATSRNNKTIDLNIINNINSNKYLLIDDKNSFQNTEEKNNHINNNLNNNRYVINSRIINKNNNKNILINKKNSLKRIKNNIINKSNPILFKRIEKKNKLLYNKRTLSKNKFNKFSLKNNSFENNKSINYSQSFCNY